MAKKQKGSNELMHIRSAAGCIHQGWVLLAEHAWDFIRGGAPILLLATVLGIALGLALPWYDLPAVKYSFYTLDFLLSLLWIIQVAGLVQKFHQQGFFPSLRPLFRSKRKDNRANAFGFWKSDWKQATRSTLGLFGLMVQNVRHWGSLLGILIVGGLVSICLTMVTSLPFFVLYFTYFFGYIAEFLGDTVTLPSLMPLYCILSGIITVVTSFMFSLFLLLPLAYFGGSLKKEKAEEAANKKLQELQKN